MMRTVGSLSLSPVITAATSAIAVFLASPSLAQQRPPAMQPSTQPASVGQPQPQPPPPPAPVATTRTTQAEYIASDRVTERTIEHRPNRTLLSTGGGIFLLSYGASVIAGAASNREADRKLFIPVVGPWLDLGDRGCTFDHPCGTNEDVAKAMVLASGIIQGAGVLLALSSLFVPEWTEVTERVHTAVLKPEVKVLPVSFTAGAGVGAIGRF
jgi:hypothetical protein